MSVGGGGKSGRRLSVFGSGSVTGGSQTSRKEKVPTELEILQQLHPADMLAVLERRASVPDMEGDARSFFLQMKHGDFSTSFQDDEDD
jgi:hypothetical protein